MFQIGDEYKAVRDIFFVPNFYRVVNSPAAPVMFQKDTRATMIDNGISKDFFTLHVHENYGNGFDVEVKKVVFGQSWTKI